VADRPKNGCCPVERARRYRKKLASGGQVRVTVTIPADRGDELLAFVATLQATP
jgi:hypothetical protein